MRSAFIWGAISAGFTGALGHFRLRDDGRCQRDLAVLGVQGRRIVVLAEVAGTCSGPRRLA